MVGVTVHVTADQPHGRISVADLREFMQRWDVLTEGMCTADAMAAEQAARIRCRGTGHPLAGAVTVWRIEADVP